MVVNDLVWNKVAKVINNFCFDYPLRGELSLPGTNSGKFKWRRRVFCYGFSSYTVSIELSH